MKPIALAVALALTAAPLLSAPPALAAPAAKAATPASPAWVARSNALAQILLDAQGPFQPEETGFFGVPGYDDKVADLGPDNGKRYRAAMAKARDELKAKLATERDPNVRQDLEIMIHAANQNIEGSELNEKYLLPWSDAPQTVFSGLNLLLSDQVPAERRAKALDRLKAYAGLQPGGTAFTTLARQRYEERLKDGSLLQPTKIEVQQSLDNVETYITGIESLLKKYQIAGADEAMKALAGQMKDYASWTRSTVLPKARTDARLPAPLYAYQLKQVGIDIDPKLLMQRAQLEFMETRSAMQQLAPGDISVLHVDRGGQVTYHGPGQIVVYPLLRLPRLGIGVRDYVCRIEQALIDTLAEWNIGAERREGAPGVYVGGAKIAALGIRVRRGCTFHGLAFNVAMDLEPFHRINPCGYQGLQVTSVVDLGGPSGMDAVKPVLLDHLARQFGLLLQHTPELPDLSAAA
ncbi:hypothetical protein STRNTR1_0319 [Stenotrophomonas maltophilia]|nr:hypothetical protein STRNTR1_0319 [Stenotrophomonas maltophilia]